jgi:hypothetical protein
VGEPDRRVGEVGEGSLADEWGRWRGCNEERDFSRMRLRRVSQNADGYVVVAAESTMLISFSFCIWGCRVRIKRLSESVQVLELKNWHIADQAGQIGLTGALRRSDQNRWLLKLEPRSVMMRWGSP